MDNFCCRGLKATEETSKQAARKEENASVARFGFPEVSAGLPGPGCRGCGDPTPPAQIRPLSLLEGTGEK